MFKKIFFILVILTLTIVPVQLQTDESTDSLEKILDGITRQEIKSHISYLASDELEGRMATSQGGYQAGEYIARIFENSGLKPGGDNNTYYQNFSLDKLISPRGIPVLGKNNTLSLKTTEPSTDLELNKDFVPLVFSASKKVADRPVVFAGYGITAPEYKYDDYKKTDIKDKIVFILKYEPSWKKSSRKSKSPQYTKHAWLATKLKQAQNNGAVGVILVTGPEGHEDEPDTLEPFQPSRSPSLDEANVIDLPFVQITRQSADEMLKLVNMNLSQVQRSINTSLKPASFNIPGLKIDLEVEIHYKKFFESEQPARNVIAYIEGSDSQLKQRAIVIGAHYDHIGLGHWGSMDRLVGQVHNGADDNASGTAAVILLAKAFSKLETKPKRSIVFMVFDAEELGCIGSKYYVEHPLFSSKQTALMVNLDMIGRSTSKKMHVELGNNPGYTFLLGETRKKNFRKKDIKLYLRNFRSISGGSDHINFYRKSIPVCYFHAGVHKDYHRVSDDTGKIKSDVMETLCKLVFLYVYEIANL